MTPLSASSSTKVLVTGTNGFLAIWVARRLLERGYSVRGTVRSLSKGEYIKNYFNSLGIGENFELAVVDDFTKEGAFDESLVGVDGVLHVATPIPSGNLVEPDDFVIPAVEGTLGILRSAQKTPSVKRVIYTSSTGTLKEQVFERTVITEDDWNDEAVKILKEQGVKALNQIKYISSKVLAEKAAWEFYQNNKETLGFDFGVILPPWILGPPIIELGSTPESMGNSSYGIFYNKVVGNPSELRSDETLEEVHGWVDVRDLADAHVTALERPDVAGERIIVSAGHASWQEWIDVANKVVSSSQVSLSHPLPKGKPGIPPKPLYIYDTSKEARLLGTPYRGMEETTRDALEVYAGQGW